MSILPLNRPGRSKPLMVESTRALLLQPGRPPNHTAQPCSLCSAAGADAWGRDAAPFTCPTTKSSSQATTSLLLTSHLVRTRAVWGKDRPPILCAAPATTYHASHEGYARVSGLCCACSARGCRHPVPVLCTLVVPVLCSSATTPSPREKPQIFHVIQTSVVYHAHVFTT